MVVGGRKGGGGREKETETRKAIYKANLDGENERLAAPYVRKRDLL
jgi:hypothetical protein